MPARATPPAPLGPSSAPLARRRRLIAVLAGVWIPATSAAGATVLSIRGRVEQPREFSIDDLAALPQHAHTTATPWYSAARKFSGPLLRDVIDATRPGGDTLRLRALNDYSVDVPVTDVRRYDVILARLLDDRPMSVREKGPLFVIYPFARHPELRNAIYYSRCAWQLRSIEVL